VWTSKMICYELFTYELCSFRLSSQVYTETTDNHTEAYRMCSGSQQGRTGVDGDGGGGSIMR
jgi:hypothetical protein